MNNAAEYDLLCRAAGDVSRETFDELKLFEARFRNWNARINLVAASTLEDLWTRHIVDSAQLFKLAKGATVWADFGSGGGFPALVIAFLLKPTSNGARITLVESNRKKAGFLQAMVGEFKLPAGVLAARLETVVEELPPPQVLTARALARTDQLLAEAERWLSSETRALYHKGRDYRAELEESALHWRFDLIEHRSVTDPHGVILEISNLKRRT